MKGLTEWSKNKNDINSALIPISNTLFSKVSKVRQLLYTTTQYQADSVKLYS